MLLHGLEFFSGAGGFTLGAVDAGCRVVASAEWEPDAATTAERAGHVVVRGDVRQFPYDEILFPIDLLFGGPPCQPFSEMGAGKGEYDRRDGFPLMLQAIDRIGPRRFCAENVTGLLSIRYTGYRQKLLADLRKRFRHVGTWVCNAKNFGVPQDRERLFIWGAEVALQPPKVTHGPGKDQPWVGVREALPGLGAPAVHVHSYTAKSRSTSEPSPTIATKGTIYTAGEVGRIFPYDWQKDKRARRMVPEELKVLQGFPGSFSFSGTLTSQHRQIGNAVPPPLGEAVTTAMLAGLEAPQLPPDEVIRRLKRFNPDARLFEPRRTWNRALVGVTNASEHSPGRLVAVYGWEYLRDIAYEESLKGLRQQGADVEEQEVREQAFGMASDHVCSNMEGVFGKDHPLILHMDNPYL